MAVSKVDAANQIENQLPQANIANNTRFRNIIINGSMDIRQRSDTTGFTGDGAYRSCDRWITRLNTLGTWDQEQSSTVPSGQGFAKSLKMTVDTADSSPAAGDFCWLEQRLEGQMLQYLKKGTSNAQQLTLSFWVRSSKTGTFIAQLQDNDNSRVVSKSYTIDTADTWEKKTITFPADTTGTLTNDNNLSLQCKFFLAAGSNLTSGTLATSWESSTLANWAVGQVNVADTANATFYLTAVQLEAGDTASDFEFLPYDVNLQRCYRYFRKVPNYTMNALATTSASGMPHIVTMRSTPTATWEQGGVTNRVYRITDAVTTTLTGASVVGNQHQLYYIYYVSSAWAMTSAQGSNGVLTDIEFSAEL